MKTKQTFYEQKREHNPITMLTAYDVAFAKMAETAGMDMILVGDSGANVMLGYSSTREIGMTEMLIFTAAVKRGAPNTFVVADMPYQSDSEPELALKNAQSLIAAGAQAVKIEGTPFEVIRTLREHSIEVVGHLGLLPQTATSFKQKGNTPEDAQKILEDAQKLDMLDLCAIVLEHIPESLGAQVSQGIKAPVIGIGAGRQVDGQVLVMHDALGMHPNKIPPFATRFANLWEQGTLGMKYYIDAVKNGRHPS